MARTIGRESGTPMTLRRCFTIWLLFLVLAAGAFCQSDSTVVFYKVGGGVSAPRVVKQVEPKTPSKKGHGKVVVRAYVDARGNVVNVEILHTFNADADAKAMEAVRQWKFDPATKDGKPVPVVVAVEINFNVY